MYREVPVERFHRLFYPVVPAIVTSSYMGEVAGMMASSCMPVSLNPPMVAVAIMTTHRTYRVVKNSGAYAVCWLPYEKLEQAKFLGEVRSIGEVVDKLKAAGLEHEKGKVLDVPIPKDAVAWLECKVAWSRVTGDHELFTADVKAAYAIDDFREYWEYRRYHPIIYIGRAREGLEKYVRFSLP